MGEEEINNRSTLLNELLKDDKSHLPWFIREPLEISERYTDFVLNFLMRKRKGIGKIDRLVLQKNGINFSVDYFFEKENSINFGYVDVIKKTDKYLILKINENGLWKYSNNCVKYKIYVPTFFTRFRITVFTIFRKIVSALFITFPNKLKIFTDSGIYKLILFLIAVITFILKWDEIKNFIHRITE
ncbi:hypothetical protein [Flavobacterium sp.]|uniref:hypothetical protein n=1 Tax=Flavobacterium sp. TaxID=239 RepID=UPI0031E2F962